MKFKLKLSITSFFVFLLFLIFNFSLNHSTPTKLRAGFPTSILLANPTLLNPANLETTQEYYLMENLTATLLRSSEDPSGEFVGYLSESWRVEGTQAIFKIRSDLLWSDGSAIQCSEIASFFNALKAHPHRHLQAIRTIQSIDCNLERSEIIFVFETKPPESLFHELTLADTGLLKPLTDQQSWSVTSGPYFVSGIDAAKKEVILSKNPNSPLRLNPRAPDQVVLREIPFHLDKPLDPRSDQAVDYVAPQSWSFLPKVIKLLDQAPHKIEGRPSMVHFISFIHAPDSVRSALKEAALEANSVQQALPRHTTPYHEMIPPGYNGYLNRTEVRGRTDPLPKAETLTLVVRPQYDALTAWLDQLKREAQKKGILITYEFGDITQSDLRKRKENVAILGVFKGNMKDPISSWSFLGDPDHGALRGYSSEVQSRLSRAVEAKSSEEKKTILADLHRMVLDRHYIIPLWCERLFMIYNDQVDSIRANPFDFRIHFYEVFMSGT